MGGTGKRAGVGNEEEFSMAVDKTVAGRANESPREKIVWMGQKGHLWKAGWEVPQGGSYCSQRSLA